MMQSSNCFGVATEMHSTGYGAGEQSGHSDPHAEAAAREDTSRIAHLYFAASRLAETHHSGLRFKTVFVADAHERISVISDAQWTHIKSVAGHLLHVSPTMENADVMNSERIINLAISIFVVEEVATAWGSYNDPQMHPDVLQATFAAQYLGGTGVAVVVLPDATHGAPMAAPMMYGPPAQMHLYGQGRAPQNETGAVGNMHVSSHGYPLGGGYGVHQSRAVPVADDCDNPQRHAQPSPRAIASQPLSSGGAHCIFCESGDRPTGKLFKDLSRHMFRHFDAFEADGATGGHVLSVFHRVRYGDAQGLSDIVAFWDAYADYVARATGGGSGARVDTAASGGAITIDHIISTGTLLNSGSFSSIFQCKSAPKGQSRGDVVARVLSTIQYVGRESRIRAAKRLAVASRAPRLFRKFVCTSWLAALRKEEMRSEDAGLTEEFWEAANDTGSDTNVPAALVSARGQATLKQSD
eukprot:Opistho-2@28517